MESKRFTVGSRAFFSGQPDFNPKDIDYLSFTDRGNGFGRSMQRTDGNCCHFLFVRKPKYEMIDEALTSGPAMAVGKFLVPDVAKELSLSFQDLIRLRPLIDRLDKKHSYERIIYESYIANEGFTLTEDQLAAAYACYQAARPSEDKPER